MFEGEETTVFRPSLWHEERNTDKKKKKHSSSWPSLSMKGRST
jgi:hypothetical protein